MNKEYITRLQKRGFFKKAQKQGASIYLATPYKVVISAEVIKILRLIYLPAEEKGGIFWARATSKGGERIITLEKVSFIRNAIDDKPRQDERTSANAYLPDATEFTREFQDIITAEYLPLTFHTHPIRGNSLVEEVTHRNNNMDTSYADIDESQRLYSINGNNVHLPRVLVMGSTTGNELYIRLYGGNNSPMSFKEASKDVMAKNIDSLFSQFDWKKFSTGQKVLTGAVAAAAILGAVLKPKVAAAIALAGTPIALSLITDTTDPATHYCRISDDREAIILVPVIAI